MATKAEMRQRVAEELSLTPVGEAIASQDATRIDATYSEVYERLKEEGLAYWASSAGVPTKVVPYYALMMEEKLARAYGTSDARYQRILSLAGQDGDAAMMKIARLLRPDYQSTDDVQDY